MNILSFLGSPRKNGNTAALLDAVLGGLRDGGMKTGEPVFLNDRNIRPCQGCNSCKKNESGMCVVQDDMQEIYPSIAGADMIILATPIYWWSVTAQMKLLIDRLYGMNYRCGRKKIVLLMTYGGELPNSGPETLETLFREICEYLKMEAAGVMGVCTGSTAVRDNAQALKDGYDLGRSLSLRSEGLRR
jgi:multimeric flavodoxin WrbA